MRLRSSQGAFNIALREACGATAAVVMETAAAGNGEPHRYKLTIRSHRDTHKPGSHMRDNRNNTVVRTRQQRQRRARPSPPLQPQPRPDHIHGDSSHPDDNADSRFDQLAMVFRCLGDSPC